MLSPLTAAAVFLVLTIDPGGEDAVRELLGDVAALQRSVGFRVPGGALQVVAAIGSDAWDRLFAGPRPRELHPFVELAGARHRAPATEGDLLFHIRSNRMDLSFEYATQVMARLGGAVKVVDEVQGFRYFDERDLMGFVDGTESPQGPAAVTAAIVDADADPEFAGGSYVIVQKYLHDMASWNALSVEEQERVIGRTKLSDIELPDDVKPADSHVALNTVTGPDGDELSIVRANMPFGNPGQGEFGTYYIALLRHPGGHRADAREHVHRAAAGQHRPDTRLLHRDHRQPVLRPGRGFSGEPAGPAVCLGRRPPPVPRRRRHRVWQHVV